MSPALGTLIFAGAGEGRVPSCGSREQTERRCRQRHLIRGFDIRRSSIYNAITACGIAVHAGRSSFATSTVLRLFTKAFVHAPTFTAFVVLVLYRFDMRIDFGC